MRESRHIHVDALVRNKQHFYLSLHSVQQLEYSNYTGILQCKGLQLQAGRLTSAARDLFAYTRTIENINIHLSINKHVYNLSTCRYQLGLHLQLHAVLVCPCMFTSVQAS